MKTEIWKIWIIESISTSSIFPMKVVFSRHMQRCTCRFVHFQLKKSVFSRKSGVWNVLMTYFRYWFTENTNLIDLVIFVKKTKQRGVNHELTILYQIRFYQYLMIETIQYNLQYIYKNIWINFYSFSSQIILKKAKKKLWL